MPGCRPKCKRVAAAVRREGVSRVTVGCALVRSDRCQAALGWIALWTGCWRIAKGFQGHQHVLARVWFADLAGLQVVDDRAYTAIHEVPLIIIPRQAQQ